MKLSHVSVLKGHGTNEKNYCIRAELEDSPSPLWSRFFQLTWLITPASRKLSTDIQTNKNDILIIIKDPAKIPDVVNAVKETLATVNKRLVADDNIFLQNWTEKVI